MKENRQKGQQIKIRVNENMGSKLKEVAIKEERSINYMVNKAIELFLESKAV